MAAYDGTHIIVSGWEAILSAENSGQPLGGRGALPEPRSGAHSTAPDIYGNESEPLTHDPVTECALNWETINDRVLLVMLSAKGLWSTYAAHIQITKISNIIVNLLSREK